MSENLDNDLSSIQQARRLAKACREAQRAFADADAATVDGICQAVSDAALIEAERLAQLAHDETGYGVVADKVLKNQVAARDVWASIRDVPTVGVIARDARAKTLTIATPVGVIAALTPSTNPTSTAIFKVLIALKGRNGIVISPHPVAARCTLAAVNVVAEAAERAGAPKGLIGCLDGAAYAGTQELLRHHAVNLILATGSGAMVRAAHSVGKPAYGVGPGNVPVWVDRSADIAKAARDIVASKTFDCSTICASEQCIVADEPIAQALRSEMEVRGAYWLSREQSDRLAGYLFKADGAINPPSVGQTALSLAAQAGLQVPAQTRLLIAPLDGIGPEHSMSREKLTSVLGFMVARDAAHGLDLCVSVLKFGGDGHTAALHSADAAQVEHMAGHLPAFRIIVNSMSSLGAVGHTCDFAPSFTLGTGGVGGAISGDNITVSHLINTKRVAWELRNSTPTNPGESAGVGGSMTNVDEIVAKVLARLQSKAPTRS